MRTVKDSFNINNATVLVCEMFEDEEVTKTLHTDIGRFNKDEFVVEKVKACFSTPTTRNIVIKKANLSQKINDFSFV